MPGGAEIGKADRHWPQAENGTLITKPEAGLKPAPSRRAAPNTAFSPHSVLPAPGMPVTNTTVFWSPMMPRSTKKKIKKEVVVVKVDEDRLDFMRYLGEDMAEMADEIKEKNMAAVASGAQNSKNSSILVQSTTN